MKTTAEEPADRVVKLTASIAETLALAKYHMSQCTRMKNAAGRMVYSGEPMKTKGVFMALAKDQIKAHGDRAKELVTLAKKAV